MEKNILNEFNKDFEPKLDKQKKAIFNDFEKETNPIKQSLDIHIDPSHFDKWYTKNAHPNGADLYVNKEIGKFLNPFELNGKTSIIQEYDGRRFVIAKVEGRELPFYSSSQGTGGKDKGKWYPFYGFSESGWVMKDGFDKDGNWVYNREAEKELQEKIKKIAKLLNENISLPLSPVGFVENLDEYFDYREIDDKTDKKIINNSLGLPENIDTKNINKSSGYDELVKIKKFFLEMHTK